MKRMQLLSVLIVPFLLLSIQNMNAQTYVGSNVCMTCHNTNNPNVGYNIWQEFMNSGHPYKLNAITGNNPPVFPPNTSPGVPTPPPGKSWTDFSYMIGGYGWKARFVYPNGLVYTENPEAQYNLETQQWVPYNLGQTTKYNYNCFKCHTTGPSPEGSWTGNPADSMGTFSEPGIKCEGCHGPASDHIANPINVKPPIQGENLTINRCGDCHQRGGTTNQIPASGGYIKHHEQINELRASKHGNGQAPDLTCASCHETHIPLKYNETASTHSAIKTRCQDCHTDKQVLLNGQPKPIDCVDCHMAPAGKSAVGQVVGNGRRGDVKTHIFAINTNPVTYTAMFTQDGSKVQLDSNGLAAVTLDFACLRCHTTQTVDWAASYAQNIHINGINGIDDNKDIPASFALEQNYPNPFNPSTTIKFSLPKSTNVKLDIYNISGEYITTLVKDYMPAGYHSIQFIADGLSSGVYIYKLIAGETSFSKKMVLMK